MKSFLLPIFSGLASAALTCRPDGPVVPKPRLREAATLRDAAANLTRTLDAAVSGTIKAGWPIENVSFSVAVVSRDQEDPGVPLWEYHHLAKRNVNGTKNIGRDSQYLIGSISKVVSDYILLTSGLDVNAPVTKYLPKLRDSKSKVHWDDVTLAMLAGQRSGAPTNYGFSEHYGLKELFLSSGFPPIDDSAYPPCGVLDLNKACTKEELLNGMLSSYPVVAPGERAAYSNIAFTIFIMAVEEATGKTYAQLVEDALAKSLRMNSTRPSPGDDEKAVIPPGENSWGTDFGLNAPGGGLVSTISDLSRFAYAVLTRTTALTPAQTRTWLKPNEYSGSFSAVGKPWEIFRHDNITPEHPHSVTVHGKSGGAQAYRSQLNLLDEYGVGLIVLCAGPMNAITLLNDVVLAGIAPAVDKVAREQADKGYARTFKNRGGKEGGNANTVEVDATFEMDKDSLVVKAMHRNGSDMHAAITQIWNLTMAQFTAELGPTLRLFPTDQDEKTTLDGRQVTREVWRLWPELADWPASDLPAPGTLRDDCVLWMLGDWVHYGEEPMDRFLFYKDDKGEVLGFEAPFLRTGILRPSK
ncbi:Actin- protein 6 [Purpureocillium takamizusanense]|uniref:Actin- protein 6 n=1 Tax=Purpureocillium takamizusanense TaxID=2060973 RepID=A0A9Q8QMI9_9HYPO|nr:Actin- protein 6 [Purpureocillium takamizusanense]UNI22813.1 Actin- protein 6 [Purpureocillium takamizusanense]